MLLTYCEDSLLFWRCILCVVAHTLQDDGWTHLSAAVLKQLYHVDPASQTPCICKFASVVEVHSESKQERTSGVTHQYCDEAIKAHALLQHLMQSLWVTNDVVLGLRQ
jgi:hypothetical protein